MMNCVMVTNMNDMFNRKEVLNSMADLYDALLNAENKALSTGLKFFYNEDSEANRHYLSMAQQMLDYRLELGQAIQNLKGE